MVHGWCMLLKDTTILAIIIKLTLTTLSLHEHFKMANGDPYS